MSQLFWDQVQKTRQLNIILSWIKKCNETKKHVDKHKLILAIQSEFKVSRYTAKNYLELLENQRLINLDGNIVCLKLNRGVKMEGEEPVELTEPTNEIPA